MNPETNTEASNVTVVISTYNRAPYIRYALDGFLAQTLAVSRIIVVDDGSTDNTHEVLEQYGDSIDVIRQKNSGKATALNRALPMVDTEFVWFFDDDDVVLPAALEALMAAHQKQSNLAFTFGDFLRTQGETVLTTAEAKKVPYRFSDLSETDQRNQLFHKCTISMSGALIRTSSIREIGGFNESLIRAQDYDLIVRLASRFSFSYCGTQVFINRIHAGVRGSQAQHHSHRDRMKAWARYNRPIGFYLRYNIPVLDLVDSADGSGDDRGSRGKTASSDISSGGMTLRRALVTRAWILANKLPPCYAIADLREASVAGPHDTLTDAERDLIVSAFGHTFVAHQGRVSVLNLIGLYSTRCGIEIAKLVVKSRYWAERPGPMSIGKLHTYLTTGTVIFLASILRPFRTRMEKSYSDK